MGLCTVISKKVYKVLLELKLYVMNGTVLFAPSLLSSSISKYY